MKRYLIALPVLFVLVYILPLGARPISIPDESRYAEIPREMIASGDWIVPRLNGLRYFEKPVLGYWLNALSISLFGENAFAMRLNQALATGISALIVFLLLGRFGGGARTGALGATAYLTCLLVFIIGTINILDSILSMFLTGAMASFFFAYRENVGTRRAGWLALFGLFCGLAFLVKGFLAFAVPVITIVPFMIWERRFTWFLRLMWVPVLTLFLVILPWSMAIHLRESNFWNYFFWTEHIKRFFSPIPGQHMKPFWYFVPILLGGALPWTVAMPAALSGLKGGGRAGDPLVRFALCWFLFPFIFFSLCGGKLAPYILPCFPPLVIVAAVGLVKLFEAGRGKAFALSASFVAVLTGGAAVALVVSQSANFAGFRAYGPEETWKWVIGAAGLLFWSGFALFSARRSDNIRSLALFAAAPVLLLASLNFIVPDSLLEEKAPGDLLRRNRHMVAADTALVTDEYLVHAVCWTYKRSNVYLLERAGELRYGLAHDESNDYRLLTLNRLRKMIEERHAGGRIILLAEENRWKEWKGLLPEPEFEDKDKGVVFIVFNGNPSGA